MADETTEKDWQQALEWASFSDEEGKEKLQETACGSDLSLCHHNGLDPQASFKERFREVSLRREKQLWLTFNELIFFTPKYFKIKRSWITFICPIIFCLFLLVEETELQRCVRLNNKGLLFFFYSQIYVLILLYFKDIKSQNFLKPNPILSHVRIWRASQVALVVKNPLHNLSMTDIKDM